MAEHDDDVRKPVLPDSELLQLLFESATDFAIFTMDPNGVTTTWNTGAERLFGYKEQEILGRSADVIFPPEPDGLNAAAEERRLALAHGRAEDERSQARRDGSLFWGSGLLMPLADRSVGFVKIVRDRTCTTGPSNSCATARIFSEPWRSISPSGSFEAGRTAIAPGRALSGAFSPARHSWRAPDSAGSTPSTPRIATVR